MTIVSVADLDALSIGPVKLPWSRAPDMGRLDYKKLVMSEYGRAGAPDPFLHRGRRIILETENAVPPEDCQLPRQFSGKALQRSDAHGCVVEPAHHGTPMRHYRPPAVWSSLPNSGKNR